MRAKFIYEKFTQDSDPIKDMGIGFKDIIKISDVKDEYWKKRSEEIKKAQQKIMRQTRNEIKKKLIGKVISGYFISNNTTIKAKVRVSRVETKFSINSWNSRFYDINYIYVYGKRGKRYQLRNGVEYEITS